MAEPAFKRMSLDEFLRWDDDADARSELVDGFPVAMAPPAEAHRILTTRLVSRIDAALANRRPCNAQTEAGTVHPDRGDSYFIADIAVTCRPNERRRRQAIAEPLLLVEILSPGTERHDRRIKLPIYSRIDSVREILLLDSEAVHAELLRREGDRWVIQLIRGADATLPLASVGVEIALAELYDGIDIAAENDI